MATSAAPVARTYEGKFEVLYSIVTLGTYVTGGETVNASDLNAKAVVSVAPQGLFVKADKTLAVAASWVRGTSETSGKFVCHRQKDPGNAGGADIQFPEVANSVDLSGYSALCRIVVRL